MKKIQKIIYFPRKRNNINNKKINRKHNKTITKKTEKEKDKGRVYNSGKQ